MQELNPVQVLNLDCPNCLHSITQTVAVQDDKVILVGSPEHPKSCQEDHE